jgi:hypothetical protein
MYTKEADYALFTMFIHVVCFDCFGCLFLCVLIITDHFRCPCTLYYTLVPHTLVCTVYVIYGVQLSNMNLLSLSCCLFAVCFCLLLLLYSVCATMQMFRKRFSGTKNKWLYGSSVPFHYMKHAPMVGIKKVFEQMEKEPSFSKMMKLSHSIPFRSGLTIQPDFLHHHIIRQTDVSDYGASFGWNAEMHLIMLDGSNPSAFVALTKEWSVKAPLFFTINDLGWRSCSVGRNLHSFFQSIFSVPSEFEVKDATKYLSLGYCDED